VVIVVLDSNVSSSALEFGGSPELALTQAMTIDQLAISDFIEHEVVRVLTRKLRRDPLALQAVLDEILRWAYRAEIQHAVSAVCRAPTTIPYWRLPWRRRLISSSLATGTCSV
jgi:hypothetical protein